METTYEGLSFQEMVEVLNQAQRSSDIVRASIEINRTGSPPSTTEITFDVELFKE